MNEYAPLSNYMKHEDNLCKASAVRLIVFLMRLNVVEDESISHSDVAFYIDRCVQRKSEADGK